MAKTICVICGLETFRLVFNEPLCPNCDPIGTGVVILRERMYTAKEEYWQLLEQGERLNSEAVARTHGIPHPAILTGHDFGRPAAAREYVPRGNLANKFRGDTTLSDRQMWVG